ncbi:MAG: hypothetical protein IIZ47_03040, partial [Erysipelotrichaceae bacterium]|nr:hypothetical protein [Erysipelotrichaceae bacterium]
MSTLNEKYAQALLTLAKKQDRVREIRDELETVRSLFSDMRVSVKLGVEDEESSLNKRISAQIDGMNLFLKDERFSPEVKREIAKTLL